MAKFKIEFETKAYITVFVDAENKDEAIEIACDETRFSNYSPKTNMGTTLAINGEENSFIIESDNLGDCSNEVEEL